MNNEARYVVAGVKARDLNLPIDAWSRRLAVGPFAGTPFEGRVFWPEANSDRQIAANIAGVEGFMLSAQIFVPADQVPAHRKAAISHVDQMIAARGNA